jgi:hypothetical protein
LVPDVTDTEELFSANEVRGADELVPALHPRSNTTMKAAREQTTDRLMNETSIGQGGKQSHGEI